MNHSSRIRLLIDGASRRCVHLWAPLFQTFRDDIDIVGVVSRSESSAKALGEQLSVPYGTDFDAMVAQRKPDSAFVCVTAEFNGIHGMRVVQRGLHMLGETPIAWKIAEADQICSIARQKNLTVEITENLYRMPILRAVRSLLDTGKLGRVHTVTCDGFLHEYHAFGTARAMIGFDKVPTTVCGFERHFPLSPSTADEIVLDALVQFASGELVAYHWPGGGYSSPARRFRLMKLTGTAGSALVQFCPPGERKPPTASISYIENASAILLESRYVYDPDQPDRLAAIDFVDASGQRAHRWDNLLCAMQRSFGVAWNDDQSSAAACLVDFIAAVRHGTPLTYGPINAKLDQEICVAIRQSKGAALCLPLPR
jgi:hypothetical protein